jgi:enoyl-CoA hydratase
VGDEARLDSDAGVSAQAGPAGRDPASEDVVRIDAVGSTLVITINRPHARNALNLPVVEGLAAGFGRLDEDRDVRVGVVAGAGGGFCSGMDLAEFSAKGRATSELVRGLMRRGTKKPLVAAIEGFAVAGGFELALMCDLIVAAEDARFALPEVKRSLVANAGGILHLPRRIPFYAASEIALTGGFIPATRVHQWGLVNRLTAPGQALEAAMDLASEVAANAPLAVRATKELLHLQFDDALWDRQDLIANPIFDSEDAREGARAFLERRTPQWRDR